MIILQAVSISYIQTINEKDWFFASPFFYTKVKCKEDIRNPLRYLLKAPSAAEGLFQKSDLHVLSDGLLLPERSCGHHRIQREYCTLC